MTAGSLAARLRNSLLDSAGTVVFGMEDGTVSIFGLVLGVVPRFLPGCRNGWPPRG